MTTAELMALDGHFCWFWNHIFFIATSKGNFVWNDPDYGGDNTIRPYAGSYGNLCVDTDTDYGRDKGKHRIETYCSNAVFVNEPWVKGQKNGNRLPTNR